MDNEMIVPYRTASGLEIGKNYVPPKGRDIRLDLVDVYDQDMIQMAYITNGEQMRQEKMATLWCVCIAVAIIFAMLFLGQS